MTSEKPQLLLHIGTHKTATTAIQRALSHNRERLVASGIYYPNSRPYLASKIDAHHALAHVLADPESPDKDGLEAFRDHLRDAAVNKGLMPVISAEPFYRYSIPNGRWEGISTADTNDPRQAYRARVADYFSDFNVSVLLYFRRQDRFAESLYKQRICGSHYKVQFPTYLSDYQILFDYERQIQDWRFHFPNVIAKSYDKALCQGIVASFFRYLNVEPPNDGDDGWIRRSVGNRAICWILQVKLKHQLSINAVRRRWLFALRNPNLAVFKESSPSSFFNSSSERKQFLRNYQSPLLSGFFDEPHADEFQPVTWSNEQHEEAERGFTSWEEDNSDYLSHREAKYLLPFVHSDDDLIDDKKDAASVDPRGRKPNREILSSST